MPTSRRTLVDAPQIRTELNAVDDDLAFLEFLQRVDAADQVDLPEPDGPQITMRSPLGDIEVDVA